MDGSAQRMHLTEKYTRAELFQLDVGIQCSKYIL